MVKLALYKSRRPFDVGAALIRWWTKSPYSHCELIVGDLWYSSSLRDGGVRVMRIDPDPDHWDFVELPWVEPVRVKAFYAKTAGQRYSWADLIKRQIFNREGDSDGYFCSEWCAGAAGVQFPQTYSPGRLGAFAKARLQHGRDCH